jgi:hypothetical protein
VGQDRSVRIHAHSTKRSARFYINDLRIQNDAPFQDACLALLRALRTSAEKTQQGGLAA